MILVVIFFLILEAVVVLVPTITKVQGWVLSPSQLVVPPTITRRTLSTTTTTTTQRTTTPSQLYMNKNSGSSSKGFGGSSSNSSTSDGAKKTVGVTRQKKLRDRSKPKGFAGALRDLQMQTFPYSGTVKPGKQSPQRIVDPQSTGIMIPDYALDGRPKTTGGGLLPWIIEVKTSEEIEKMRHAGRVAREVLDIAGSLVEPGVTTDYIDTIVHEETLKRGAYPSPLNYHGFPKSCCTSVNEIICHGIPDDRKLVEGDIINLDITCYLDGYHGDCSEMFVVGDDCNDKGKDLLQVTYDSWLLSLNYVKPGRDYKDLGGIIEDYVTSKGFSTVKKFCGHGIGSVFHTTPNILHYRNNEPNGQMSIGHTFTIEPMICEGTSDVLTWPDEWTAATLDGKRSAQFEHTLLVTSDGVEPLTKKIDGSSKLQFWEQNSHIHQGFWLGTTSGSSSSSSSSSTSSDDTTTSSTKDEETTGTTTTTTTNPSTMQ